MGNNGPSVPFIPRDATLVRPAEPTRLFARMNELVRLQLPAFTDRAELAGLWVLLTEGNVTAGRLQEVLLTFYHFPLQNPDEESAAWLEPVRRDQGIVWQRLFALVSDESTDVATEVTANRHAPDYQSPYEQQANEWLRGVMHTLAMVVDSADTLGSGVVAGYLPQGLENAIRSQAAYEWFASPYVIGEAIEALGIDSAFGATGQGAIVTEALARAVLHELSTYRAASDSNEQSQAVGRAKLWWMLLKGIVHHGIASARPGSGIVWLLANRPDIVDRIAEALQEGIKVLKTVRDSGTIAPEWGGRSGSPSELAPTPTLVQQLYDSIAHIRADTETLRRLS